MMDNGYIKLHRKLLDCSVFQNEKLLKVWIWCLFKATYKDRQVIMGNTVIDVKQGQFVYGRLKAAEELKIPPSTFKRYMDILQELDMLTLKSTNKWTLASITNWEKYQSEQQTDSRWTADNLEIPTSSKPQLSEVGQQSGQQMDTNKNINNNNNKRARKPKAERNIIPPSLEMVTDYCIKRKNRINPQYFIDYYETRDWCVGKNKMKDWQAAIRTWENNDRQRNQTQTPVVTEVKRYDV